MNVKYRRQEAELALEKMLLNSNAHVRKVEVEILPDFIDSLKQEKAEREMNEYLTYLTVMDTKWETNSNSSTGIKINRIKKLRELLPGLGLLEAKRIFEAPMADVFKFAVSGNSLRNYNVVS